MTAPALEHAEDPAGRSAAEPGWPVPVDEEARVAALRSYAVLDQPPQADLDAAARLAAHVCGTSVAVVNLLDGDRVWQAAAAGTERREYPRSDMLCQFTVLDRVVVHVPDASRDSRFSPVLRATGTEAAVGLYASAPLVTHDGFSIGTVCVFDPVPRTLSPDQLDRLADVAAQVMALFEMRRMAAALSRLARKDPLTGLANRRTVEQVISSAIVRAERGLGTPSVVVVDLDRFKEVNDAFGHGAGDAVLRAAARRLTASARTVDTVGRLGGDEFVVLLEHTGGSGATAALNRLRECLAAADDDEPADSFLRRLPASLGMATYRPGDSVASMLARADAEMYADKARRG
jgi:diguanylate cyclase (GGDEF)-like protein